MLLLQIIWEDVGSAGQPDSTVPALTLKRHMSESVGKCWKGLCGSASDFVGVPVTNEEALSQAWE